MSEINCNACEELKSKAPHFVENGITDTECTSLAADTGLNPNLRPTHNDATDLHNVNDCLVGRMANDLEKYEMCDWQDFMAKFIPNLYDTIKAIICALGGIWTFIHNILSRVANLEGRMTTVEGRVDDLEDEVDSITTDISGLKNRMSTAEGNISNLQSDMTGVKNRVGTLEGNYTTLNTTVNNLSTTVNNLSGTVSGNTASINSINSSIASINNKIAEIIAAMGGDEDELPVMKRYRFTVPAEAFTPVWRTDDGSVVVNGSWVQTIPSDTGIIEWFAGGGNNQQVGEMWIRVPVSEMDSITGVWTQTWVVPSGNPFDGRGKGYMQTVNVQEWYEDNGYLVINFDTYILAPQRFTTEQMPSNPQNGGPYPVTVDFLVVGKKTINT